MHRRGSKRRTQPCRVPSVLSLGRNFLPAPSATLFTQKTTPHASSKPYCRTPSSCAAGKTGRDTPASGGNHQRPHSSETFSGQTTPASRSDKLILDGANVTKQATASTMRGCCTSTSRVQLRYGSLPQCTRRLTCDTAESAFCQSDPRSPARLDSASDVAAAPRAETTAGQRPQFPDQTTPPPQQPQRSFFCAQCLFQHEQQTV